MTTEILLIWNVSEEVVRDRTKVRILDRSGRIECVGSGGEGAQCVPAVYCLALGEEEGLLFAGCLLRAEPLQGRAGRGGRVAHPHL